MKNYKPILSEWGKACLNVHPLANLHDIDFFKGYWVPMTLPCQNAGPGDFFGPEFENYITY